MPLMYPHVGGGGLRERRYGRRIPVELAATICSTSIVRKRVVMTDLSLEGCRVAAPFEWTPGTVVVITIPTLAPRMARICWRDASSLGLRFAERLNPAVVEHLTNPPA